jgi:hypothetical protein
LTVDVLANDRDPEGGDLQIIMVSPPTQGIVVVAEGGVELTVPGGFAGVLTFTYVVADAAGQQTVGNVSVSVTPRPADGLGIEPLQPSLPAASLSTGNLEMSADGSSLFLGSLAQSVYVLRMPLSLFGGAILMSMMAGGVLNVGVLFGRTRRRGRRARLVAVALAKAGERIPVVRSPSRSEIMHRLDSTTTLIRATGKSRQRRRIRYEEIETPDGLGWVDSCFITDQVDLEAFSDDPRPGELLDELVDRFRRGRRLDDLLSDAGLFVVHHGEPIHAPRTRRVRSPEIEWSAPNPGRPARVGTFREVVAPEIVDAFDDPDRIIEIDRPLLRSTRIPTEFANLHSLSVGRSGRHDGRPSWMVFFDYDADHVSIVGLLREA